MGPHGGWGQLDARWCDGKDGGGRCRSGPDGSGPAGGGARAETGGGRAENLKWAALLWARGRNMH
jgi:hypothetical protein